MAGHSFADFIRKWEILNNALKQQLPDMPHLTQDQADFEALITEAKGLDDQQKLLRGKLQDTTKQRRAAQLKGVDLNERLAAQLKGHLGPRNQNLVGFGLRARQVPKRRKTDSTNPPPVPPPTVPPPTVHPPPVQESKPPGTVAPVAQEVTPPSAGVK
jgi:hypothetical protein